EPRSRAGLAELASLAPTHPAIRGAQRRAPAAGPAQAGPAQGMGRAGASKRGGGAARAGHAGGAARAGRGASRGVLASLPAPMRWAVVSMMVVVLLALAAAAGIIGSGLMAPAKTSTTTVQPGQSLWDVAAATGAADVSEAMAQIVDLNGLDSSTIHPGQSLVVPAH
ncbi:LysM peptidoglycan-binding domain-containing protein, partial [Actinomyces marmotae]